MKIIILAGGEGKRMWPIQTDKYLIPFLGQPLISYTLKRIADGINFDEVIIVTKEASRDQVSQIASSLGIKHKIAIQEEPKGMADALLSAKEDINGEILVINAEDVLEERVYQDVLTTASDTQSDVVLSGLQVKSYFPGGYLEVKRDRIQGIVEKPGKGNEPSDLVKLVVDYFRDGGKLVSYLEEASSEKDDVYEVALAKICDSCDVRFIRYNGVWIPLKYPWQILETGAYFLSTLEQNISPGSKVSDKAIIEGNVKIEEGAKVFEGAVIKGPCYIGKNVIVGNNTMIRESILEEGVVTGFNCDITRSYIGRNSWFHTNYVGDSVIEGDFGMGSGAVLANLRLDDATIRIGDEKIDTGRTKLGTVAGKGSRVGVNASIMPGVRIGVNCLIGPGVVLHEDVKDNTRILVKQQYQVSKRTPSLTSYDQFRKKL
ncbi:NTP transferase domain-containing protein [Candidatus Daviesbacteria bacterium]|nr:NTP transferase domain-containing protein [Candidatus Daviesbacteria bacterium]